MKRIWSITVQSVRVMFEPKHLKRTLLITVVVGIWLTMFNQIDHIVEYGINLKIMGKIFLNFLTPFAVSNAGLLSREVEVD